MAAIGTGYGDDFGTCKYCGGTTFNGCCMAECAHSCKEVPGTDAAHGDNCDCQGCSDEPMAGWDEDTQTWGDGMATFAGFHTCPLCRLRIVEGMDNAAPCTMCQDVLARKDSVKCDKCENRVPVVYTGEPAPFPMPIHCDDCESAAYYARMGE